VSGAPSVASRVHDKLLASKDTVFQSRASKVDRTTLPNQLRLCTYCDQVFNAPEESLQVDPSLPLCDRHRHRLPPLCQR
jgi:hypothetical protein